MGEDPPGVYLQGRRGAKGGTADAITRARLVIVTDIWPERRTGGYGHLLDSRVFGGKTGEKVARLRDFHRKHLPKSSSCPRQFVS